jgi:hypothetical protein
MVRRKIRESLPETKRRLIREQEERTEARIRQLLPPVTEEDSDSEEEWTEVVRRIRQEVRQERKERVRQRADLKALKAGSYVSRLCGVFELVVFGVLFVILFMFALSVGWHVGIKRAA